MGRKGSISVFLKDHFYLGPDWRFSLLLPGLTGLGTVLFTAYTCEVVVWKIIIILLYALHVVVYGLAAFRDPGVVTGGVPLERGISRPPTRWVRLPNYSSQPPRSAHPTLVDRGLPPPPPPSFTEGYHVVEQRWCYTCHLYRPLRSVHCRFCDVCLYRRDHHCPWLGICVAEKNYGFFYGMLWSIIILEAMTGILSAMDLARRASAIDHCCTCASMNASSSSSCPDSTFCRCDVAPTLTAVTQTYGIELLVTALSFIVSLSIAAMMADHTRQICRNELLGDDSRYGATNVYDRGSFWKNIKASLCYSSEEAMIAYEVYEPHQEVEAPQEMSQGKKNEDETVKNSSPIEGTNGAEEKDGSDQVSSTVESNLMDVIVV